MSQSLQFLRSTGAGSRPASLLPGQIAINLTDKLLFIGNGGDTIVDQNGNSTPGVVGGGFFISDLDIVTATASANSYTDTAIANLVDSAPGLLDTLNELAAALGDDPNFATTIANSVNSVQTSLDAEIVRAQAAESTLSSDLAAETTRALAAEGVNAAAISAETTRAQNAEAQLASDLAAETTRALAAEAVNAAAIAAEETRALAAEGVLQTNIDNEVTRATLSEQVLSDRVYSIEENLDTEIAVVYDDNTALFPDEKPPVEDSSYREGWYFTNAGGGKINWYFFDGTTNPSAVGDLSAYAVVTLDSLSSKPYLQIHTTPLGDGGDASSWYRSRFTFDWPAGSYVAGKKYLLVVEGASALDPKVHPELDRVYLAKDSISSVGPQVDSENAMLVSLQSNSGAAAGDVQFLADSVGVRTNAGYDVESKLRFRKVSVPAWEEAFDQGTF